MTVEIRGNLSANNIVLSEKFRRYSTGSILFNGEGARIDIGREVGFAGAVSLSTHEGAQISIGARCLIAGDTVFSASDFHPVFDVATGERINWASDIRVGEHVWVGARAMILKGASIGRDSVVGAGSIVTSDFDSNSLIVGNPARLLRSGVCWSH